MKKSVIVIAAVLLALSFAFQGYKPVQNKKIEKSNLAGSVSGSDYKDVSQIVRLAEAFKATLKDDQLALLQLPYSKESAEKWSNFPQAFSRPQRVGIGFGSLTSTQLTAAKALLQVVLANHSLNEGYDELQGILAADDFFGKTTGKTDVFGSNNFYLAFLGTPGTTALWELQFGGHHFALANTYKDGKLAGVTPAFRGVEPMAAVTADGRTYQPMEQERANFSAVFQSLSDAQKSAAKLSATFSDVLLGPGKDGQFPAGKQGIKISELNRTQQQQITKAIALYVHDLDSISVDKLMNKYISELPDTYLSFSGSGTMSQVNDYVRLDGPALWIEYSAQPSRDFPGTTHPHSVWRDKTGDYGGN